MQGMMAINGVPEPAASSPALAQSKKMTLN
jgi:hypothetical protein